ncbi:hypothetical protein ACTFIZ_001581 [Dictyostelium cf. discoideum]
MRLTENPFDFSKYIYGHKAPTYCLQFDYILQDLLVKVCSTYSSLRYRDDYNNHNNYINNSCTTTMTTTAMNRGGTLIEASVNRNGDYKNGIKTIEQLANNPGSQHTFLSQNAKQFYEGRSQTKFFVALVQLIQHDFKCAYCSEKIEPSTKVILSHNLGHNKNLENNIEIYGVSELLDGDTIVGTFRSLLNKHYLFSIIHSECNQLHFNVDGDDFGKIKKNLGTLVDEDLSKFVKIGGQNSFSYWWSEEMIPKLVTYFNLKDETLIKTLYGLKKLN